MSFLDNFSADMRTLTKRAQTHGKNAIGEDVVSGTTDTAFVALFFPIGQAGNYNKRISNHILYSESTHVMYFDHGTYSLTTKDKIVDESGNVYDVKGVEPAYDFGAGVDHHSAFLSLKQ